MRRKDRQVSDPAMIRAILTAAQIMRLGFFDGQEVYVLPLNFGYEEKDGHYTFYFHGAQQGRKIDLIREHPHVGFETDVGYELIRGEAACEFSARYASVIGNGTIELVSDPQEKQHGLRRIMAQATGREMWDFPQEMLERTAVLRLQAEKLSAKAH